jgi:hypothetical protein
MCMYDEKAWKARPTSADYEAVVPILLALLRRELSRPTLRENVEIWGPDADPDELAALDRVETYFANR